ncbi:MAG: calcium/sodium antiporter [Lachnospiraceae bacterium]|nr:calcium/sodium antiporter [Lachnospiraceae bacterium]
MPAAISPDGTAYITIQLLYVQCVNPVCFFSGYRPVFRADRRFPAGLSAQSKLTPPRHHGRINDVYREDRKLDAVLPYLLLIVGFVALIKGADWFVEGSSGFAKLAHIPPIIIGLTIVSVGTSAPEAAVSITAAIRGSNDIAVGNIIGSNLFNLLMVGGICAIMKPLPVSKSIIKKELLWSILAAGLLLVMGLDAVLFGAEKNMISRIDSLILFILFLLFITYQVRSGMKSHREGIEEDVPEIKDLTPLKCTILLLIGIALVIAGGQLVVDSATKIARSFGVSDAFIALTVIAVGTSLPELVTSIVASRKGENDLALGNIVGSNLFNILFILGASGIFSPLNFADECFIDIAYLIAISIITMIFAATKGRITRPEGICMVVLYVSYVGYLMWQQGLIFS